MRRNTRMKLSCTTTLLSSLAIMQTQIGCLSEIKPKVAETSSTPLSLATVPSLSTVDGSQLTVSDITISQYADPKLGGVIVPLVDFRYSPASDYVEAQLCEAETRDCKEVKNLFERNSTLSNASDGATVFLKLRACVNPERSTSSKNCGGWVEKQYTQWVVSESSKKQLQEEKEQVERAIKDYAQSLLDLAKLKADRAAKCKPASEGAKQLIDAERGFAEAIAKLGGSLVSAIADRTAKKPPAPPAPPSPDAPPAPPSPDAPPAPPAPDAPPAPAALGAFADDSQASDGLSLSGSGKSEIIIPQDPRYYSRIVQVIGQSIVQRAQALRVLSRSSALSGGTAFNVASGNPAERLTSSSAPAAGTTSSSGTTQTETSTKKDENLGKDLVNGTTATGSKLDLAPLINVLPDIAGAMFDLGNAERIVAATVGVCVKGFDAKQQTVLDAAQSAAEERKKILESRVASLEAKIKAGGP